MSGRREEEEESKREKCSRMRRHGGYNSKNKVILGKRRSLQGH